MAYSVSEASQRISDIIDNLNSKLPDGMKARITSIEPKMSLFGGSTKNVHIVLDKDLSILPQEFQEAIRQETERLIFGNPDAREENNRRQQEHQIHHPGLFPVKPNY